MTGALATGGTDTRTVSGGARVRAGQQKERIFEAWSTNLPLRPVRRRRVIGLSDHQYTHNHVKNSRGDTIRIDLPPIFPCGAGVGALSEYGISCAGRLYLHFLTEGALVFFVMFLLSSATISDSTSRSQLRWCCRAAASSAGGYAILVDGANESAVGGADPENGCPRYDDLKRTCGYLGRNIRRFDARLLSSAYASSGLPYLLWTAMGSCEEYANTSSRQYVIPALATPYSILEPTPSAHYCLRPFESSYWSIWMQFACLALFIAFLVRLRILATRIARQHDYERLTTADFALMFRGLDGTIPPEALTTALQTELASLGFDESKIAYIECGRHCEDELALIGRIAQVGWLPHSHPRAPSPLLAAFLEPISVLMAAFFAHLTGSNDPAQLDMQAEECEARRRALESRGEPTVSLVTRLRAMAVEYVDAKARIQQLMERPDLATGHAFVVFQYGTRRVPRIHPIDLPLLSTNTSAVSCRAPLRPSPPSVQV